MAASPACGCWDSPISAAKSIALADLNSLDAASAGVIFGGFCGALSWGKGMVAARPFVSMEQLLVRAEEVWLGLGRNDWLEAFGAHPEIGDLQGLREKFGGEQSGVSGASDTVLAELAQGNSAYKTRFGYIFIVVATGKSAAEMLGLLHARLGNEPTIELSIAAAEQLKITLLRLTQMIH
ncbi:MAG: 2-oxo-4-hydroxy-4-carboxy-5-ureidoimidazoline decarboxylase [Candidatus Marinimicrobia bacterium]|nr:2-oxo-4-hydroxy-4-carboxy-5-ureidoimidazoline decarboxylase [Candidatus Neomarinimicrobiota bacterium]